MDYSTIYRTHDSAEVSIIKHKFEEEKLNYQILDEHTSSSAGIAGMGGEGMRIQVQESQIVKAKTILKQIGYLGEWKDDLKKQRRNQPARKWIFIFLAALVLIIVAFLIMWFMNP
ncbi:putative signal transducing protein [Gillisia sp. Q332]|uniref:putative signal transducing protein n=1 Tax=Gillisia xinjiangensis TaxID=3384765 RepID=UPI00391DA208